jgi:4'-phosphopantetheinyl transferase
LSTVERERAERFHTRADRDRFVVGNALLRLAVAQRGRQPASAVRLDRTCPDCPRPHGKPVVVGGALDVSLSHSGEWIGVAVSDVGAVGLDVERVDTTVDIEQALGFALAPAEAAELHRLPADARRRAFFRYWTRKESILKATGEGLRSPMPELVVAPPDQQPRLVSSAGDPGLTVRTQMRDIDPDAAHPATLTVLSGRAVQVAVFDGHTLLAATGEL